MIQNIYEHMNLAWIFTIKDLLFNPNIVSIMCRSFNFLQLEKNSLSCRVFEKMEIKVFPQGFNNSIQCIFLTLYDDWDELKLHLNNNNLNSRNLSMVFKIYFKTKIYFKFSSCRG